MNVSVLLQQRSSWNTICLPCLLLISRWNISKSSPDFSIFPDYQLLSHYGFPSKQQNKSLWAASKEAFLMNDARFLYIPTKNASLLCKRETNEGNRKIFQSPDGNDDIREQREWRSFVCLFIFDMRSHEMIGRV